MALSNMLREPQREITETLVGIGAILLFVGIDYGFALYLAADYPDKHIYQRMGLGLLFIACGAIITFVVIMMIIGIHEMGDSICNALDKRGLYLRPQKRLEEIVSIIPSRFDQEQQKKRMLWLLSLPNPYRPLPFFYKTTTVDIPHDDPI